MDGKGGARVKPEVMEEPASKRPRTADVVLIDMQAFMSYTSEQQRNLLTCQAGARDDLIDCTCKSLTSDQVDLLCVTTVCRHQLFLFEFSLGWTVHVLV